jgi:hypothetical protein
MTSTLLLRTLMEAPGGGVGLLKSTVQTVEPPGPIGCGAQVNDANWMGGASVKLRLN